MLKIIAGLITTYHKGKAGLMIINHMVRTAHKAKWLMNQVIKHYLKQEKDIVL